MNRSFSISFLFFTIAFPFSSYGNAVDGSDNSLDTIQCCQICFLDYEIKNFEYKIINAKASSKKKTYVDSLLKIKDSLSIALSIEILASPMGEFWNEKEIIQYSDLVCISSMNFGANVKNKNRREFLFIMIYERLFNSKKNWRIQDGEKIDKLRPEYNAAENAYFYFYRGERISTKDSSEFILSLKTEWETWLDDLNIYIFELIGENYEDLEEIERIALRKLLILMRIGQSKR